MSRPRRAGPRAILTLACLTAASAASAQRHPAIAVEELMSAVRTLASPALEGRRSGTPGNLAARAWVVAQFREAGLAAITADHQMPFSFTRDDVAVTGVNVVGLCRGTGAPDDGTIVVSAHYDHVGVRGGEIHPGADDNASGVAVLLALARRCISAPWTHDAIFVAFDAEEMGLRGARAFVGSPPVAKARLALNVNLDMISRSSTRELYAAGTSHYPGLKPPLEAVAARAAISLRLGHDTPGANGSARNDWTMQSDHAAFHAAGIPFVYFGVEDHQDYHRPTDTAERVDQDFFRHAAQTVLDAVTALDRVLPLRRP
ncbi:MAG: M28 family peptidase [Acidobacteriota bacterium]